MKVLVADADQESLDLAQRTFLPDRFIVLPALDGEAAARLFQDESPDLALLDLLLPKRSGLELLSDFRRRAFTPIIMLTPSDREDHALEALQQGADDYILKPLRPRELWARAHALLRRSKEWALAPGAPPRLELGNITLNGRTRQMAVEGRNVRLSRTEFALLEFLMLNHDRVVRSGELAANVWGYSGEHNQNVVKVAVSRLRRKLEPNPASPRYIINVPGVGYMFQHDHGR